MTDKVTETVTIAAEEAGLRLDRVLAVHIATMSRSRLKTLILAGQVKIAARTIRDPAASVNSGDTVTVTLPPPEQATPEGEAIPLNIVYEDDEVIVIDKPRGLVVHPAAGHASGTLVNALIAHCGASLSGIGGVKRPGIVHRLDRQTSGVIVMARSAEAHRFLNLQFDRRLVEKVYHALVVGEVPWDEQRAEQRLRADAELDPPVEQLESLRFVLHHLAGALCAQLAARGAGAARAILEAYPQEPVVGLVRRPARVATSTTDLPRALHGTRKPPPPGGPRLSARPEMNGMADSELRQHGGGRGNRDRVPGARPRNGNRHDCACGSRPLSMYWCFRNALTR